jgi:SAM-dependent methyltransferase
MPGKAEYGVDPLIYDAGVYDAMHGRMPDVAWYLELARRARGPVLELCCGTGRITIPLAQAGIEIDGVDMTPNMLEAAQRKAKDAGIKIGWHRQDMRRLRLNRSDFRLIFIPFNSLQNTYSLEDVEKVFAGVRKHLAPGGTLAFDVFNPSVHFMVRGEKLRKDRYKFRLEDGRRVRISEICRYDSAGQVNRVQWLHRVGADPPRVQRLDMRCFYPLEMDALLKYNGFRVVAKYGDFSREPFVSASMKQVYVCRATRVRSGAPGGTAAC